MHPPHYEGKQMNIERIGYDDILYMMVGRHYPQGDAYIDRESLANIDNLKIVALWVARELSLDCDIDMYVKCGGSMKEVAVAHENAIMEVLELLEPQVKKYYMKYLNDGRNDQC